MTFSPVLTSTGLNGWTFLQQTRAKQMTALNASPQIARDKALFAERIQTIQTSDQLMADRDMLRISLGAFGLDEDINSSAFIKKVLDSDLADNRSFANGLSDKRYLALAKAFNFAGTDGPQLDLGGTSSVIPDKLAALGTADDLLADSSLTLAALKTFGLESDRNNTFFLQKVLTSDLSNPDSFANRLSDTRYADMAQAFDFHTKSESAGSITGFAELFAGNLDGLATAQDLLDSPDLLEGALKVFGLERDFARLDSPGFLLNVLESDPYDDSSFAAQLGDKRYLALSNAFAFGDVDTDIADSPAAKLIDKLDARSAPINTADDLFNDISLTLTAMTFFDLPQGAGKIDFARRFVESDPDNPVSLINIYQDKRYGAFAQAFPFQEETATRTYSAGFADAITNNYVDLQFEIGIGATDNDMRIALALERELGNLIENTGSTNSQWFAVMASEVLSSVFESAFRLPPSFGALDIDQQLKVYKERSEQFFGVATVSDYTDPDRLDDLRNSFLVTSGQNAFGGTSSSAAIVFTLLNASQ